MQKQENLTFVIFFSVNRNAPNVRRFALLRQYLAVESRSDIKIIDQAILTTGSYQFLIVTEAASMEIIKSALEHCKGILNVKVVSVANISANCQPAEERYAVFVQNNPSNGVAFTRNPEALCAAINLHLQVELCDERPYSSVLLLEAPSISKARQYGEYLFPQSNVFCTEATSPEALLKKIEGEVNDAGQTTADSLVSTVESSDRIISEMFDSASDFTIINQGSSPVTYALQLVNFYDLFIKLRTLPPQSPFSTNEGVYIWASTSGQLNFNFQGSFTDGGYPDKSYNIDKPISYDCNALPPLLFSPYMSGVTTGFDVSSGGGFGAITPLLTWLQDLLNSTTYDAPWIEDCYTSDDDRAAYKYFVDQLKGVHPKSGTVSQGTMQSIFDQGCPRKIKKTSFHNVGSHLVLECQDFETAAEWFDINGKFSIINLQIAAVSANDLKSAGTLMQINDQTSNIEAKLDAFFAIIEGLVSTIPDVGPFLYAALVIGWETAKIEIWQADATNSPIQASIANMADKLNGYLSDMTQADTDNFKTIKSNWGKLQTFANGTMGEPPIISSDQFGMTVDPNSGKPVPSQNYLDAIAKGWKLFIFQSLFASFHTPQCKMSITSGPRKDNPWNPDAGNYEYVYYLDCNYYDSNANVVTGFMEFDCQTDAPTEVMQLLFGSKSEYNLNPLVFFTGANGWRVQNIYNVGDGDGIWGPDDNRSGFRLGFETIGRF